jgi:beta-xylosidase
MPTIARSSRCAAARFFSGVAGTLVIFLSVITTAPAFAVFAGWSTPANLSVSGRNAVDPQVAVDDSGNAVAVWHRGPPSNNIVQSSFSSASNGGGGEELADTGAGGSLNGVMLFASAGLLALGMLTRVLIWHRSNSRSA